jgi:phospholipid/cholesterol/gamma-HCH transport system substrate-binding protein
VAEGDSGGRPRLKTRIAALGAVVAAIVLVALLLFGADDSYRVKARFLNAGQLVKGNHVSIAGTKAGTVEGFKVTPEGQAEVELQIDDKYAPLRRGTRAVIRQGSQSSVAIRYVDLHLPSAREAGDKIPDGGVLEADETTTSVDLDQLFNTLDPPTRRSLQRFYRGSNRQYAGRGDEANRGWAYLSPSLSASTRLFRELSHDPPVLERFLVDSSRFVTALADRRDDLAPLIENLNRTTRALGSEKEALAEAVDRFPDFMRTANTTYVNLRATLDELDPFVEASKPVAKKLRPYLAELQPFARDARPTVRNLSRVVRTRGADNDLIELNRAYPALAQIALDEAERNGRRRRGAFPEMSEAFRDSAPIVAHGRPYTVDFLGWMDDFSHTGAYDALGSFSRSQTYVNPFTVSQDLPIPEDFAAVTQEGRGELFKQLAKLDQFKRCPGGSEEPADDGSNVWSEEEQKELDCVEAHRATGPKK